MGILSWPTVLAHRRLEPRRTVGAPLTTMKFSMGGFVTYRRNLKFLRSKAASNLPLLDDFEFVENCNRWDCKFRFRLFTDCDTGMRLTALATGVGVLMLLF